MDCAFDLAHVRNGILRVWSETAFIIISDNRSENAADMRRRTLPLNNCLEFTHSFYIWLNVKEGVQYVSPPSMKQTVSRRSFQLLNLLE